MEISEYRKIFQNEETNFYYLANHKIILELVKSYLKGKNLSILEAGCGTGLLAKKLEAFGKVIAVDINDGALKFAQKRGVNVRKASVDNLPFKTSSFDLVTSVDVIYHQLVDDKKALAQIYRVLKPGGILIIRVPANSWLIRSTDAHVHTRQRYDLEEFNKKLLGAGFNILKLSFINMLLLPPALVIYLLEKIKNPKTTNSPLAILPKTINRLVAYFLFLEFYVLKWINLPFGLGLFAVCRKKGYW